MPEEKTPKAAKKPTKKSYTVREVTVEAPIGMSKDNIAMALIEISNKVVSGA